MHNSEAAAATAAAACASTSQGTTTTPAPAPAPAAPTTCRWYGGRPWAFWVIPGATATTSPFAGPQTANVPHGCHTTLTCHIRSIFLPNTLHQLADPAPAPPDPKPPPAHATTTAAAATSTSTSTSSVDAPSTSPVFARRNNQLAPADIWQRRLSTHGRAPFASPNHRHRCTGAGTWRPPVRALSTAPPAPPPAPPAVRTRAVGCGQRTCSPLALDSQRRRKAHQHHRGNARPEQLTWAEAAAAITARCW